ncbi:MAG: chemotaxis protein CheW [Deltaproteobacteria bacterium]|nr:chemotaxis protein CheW [Deltaproteobacteria bacterium]
MLLVPFDIDGQAYAIPARRVIEVVARVALRTLPGAPPAVLGAMDYRGRSVPVLDLARVVVDRPTPAQLSARIVIIEVEVTRGERVMMGLCVVGATDVISTDGARIERAGVNQPGAPYLGELVRGLASHPTLQLVDPDRLLPRALRMLFAGREGAA